MASEFKKKKRGRKAVRIVLIVVAVLAVGAAVFGVLKIRQSRRAQSTVDVQTAVAERGTITEAIDGSGNLEAAEVQGVLVPIGVTIDKVQVQAGDTVQKGDVLATVNTASVAGAIAEVDDSLNAVKNSLNASGVSSYEREELTARRSELQAIRDELVMLHDNPVITATADGVIGSVGVSDGSEITAGTSASSAAGSGTSAVSGTGTAYTADGQHLVAVSLANEAPEEETGEETNEETVPAEETGEGEAVLAGEGNEVMTDSTANNASDAGGTASSAGGTAGGNGDLSNVKITRFTGLKNQIATPVTGSTSGKSETEDPDAESFVKIDCNPLFDGELRWNPDDEVFEPNQVYVATVNLTAAEDHYFTHEDTIKGLDELVDTYQEQNIEVRYSDVQVQEDGNKVTFKLTFPQTDAEAPAATAEPAADTSGIDLSDYSSLLSGYSADYTGVSSVTGETYTDSYNSHEAEAFTIVLMENVKLKINVDELDVLQVKAGQTAVVTIDAVDGAEYEGTIERVSSTATGSTGSAKYVAEIMIPMDDNMRIGMSASATIVTGEAADVLTLPMVALQESDGETFVYTSVDESTGLPGTPVTVTVGMADGTTAEITSGLNEGDMVYYTRSMTDDIDLYY